VHIFLTGDIQVGKSTVINRYIVRKKPRIGGFRTVIGKHYADGGVDYHIIRADGADTFRKDNLVFHRGVPHSESGLTVYGDIFDSAGSALLSDASDYDLIIMDELGPKEEGALIFQNSVQSCLAGDIPVLGVVMKRQSVFLDKVRSSPSVTILEVTRENREDILQRLLDEF
jgi:nucleoside-triphosphatase